jgi:hypothetical protein
MPLSGRRASCRSSNDSSESVAATFDRPVAREQPALFEGANLLVHDRINDGVQIG